MTKSWPLLALAVLGAVAAAFCTAAFDWSAWACRLPKGEEGKVLTPDFGGCVEFWLNRYQSLIGAFVALLAAILAWTGIRHQLATTRRQTAIALLPLLDDRHANANRLLVLAEAIEIGFMTTLDAARAALDNGYQLRMKIEERKQMPLLFSRFDELFFDYKSKYEDLVKIRIRFMKETNRGVGGERIQRLCKDMQVSAFVICGRHLKNINLLGICVERIPGHRNLAAFAQIEEFVGWDPLLPDDYMTFPTEKLRDAVREIQGERDKIFDFICNVA